MSQLDDVSSSLDVGLNANISVPSIPVSLKAAANAQFQSTHTDNHAYAVLVLYRTTKKATLPNDTVISEEAAKFLDSEDGVSQDMFNNQYGDKCVKSVYYGEKTTIIIQIDKSESKKTQDLFLQLSADLAGQGGVGGTIHSVKNTLKQISSARLFINSKGTNTVIDGDKPEAINTILSKEPNKNILTPISYQLTDYTNIKLGEMETAFKRYRRLGVNQRYLQEIVSRVLDMITNLEAKIVRSDLVNGENIVELNNYNLKTDDRAYSEYVKLHKDAKHFKKQLETHHIILSHPSPSLAEVKRVMKELKRVRDWYDNNKANIKTVGKLTYVGELTIKPYEYQSDSFSLSALSVMGNKAQKLYFKFDGEENQRFKLNGKNSGWWTYNTKLESTNSRGNLFSVNDLVGDYKKIMVATSERVKKPTTVKVYATSMADLMRVHSFFKGQRVIVPAAVASESQLSVSSQAYTKK